MVREGLHLGLDVYGVFDGYDGLYKGRIEKLDRQSVSNVINRGGTPTAGGRIMASRMGA